MGVPLGTLPAFLQLQKVPKSSPKHLLSRARRRRISRRHTSASTMRSSFCLVAALTALQQVERGSQAAGI